MCGKQFVALVLVLSLASSLPAQVLSITVTDLEAIQSEVKSIRAESVDLKLKLTLLGKESITYREKLQEVEDKLTTVSQSLEKSDADLVLLKKQVDQLKHQLDELMKAVTESNKELRQLKSEVRFWKTVAISIATAVAGYEAYRGVTK